jgi:hypothetical protein
MPGVDYPTVGRGFSSVPAGLGHERSRSGAVRYTGVLGTFGVNMDCAPAGEPHGLTKLSNRRAKKKWGLAWFDKYLRGKK